MDDIIGHLVMILCWSMCFYLGFLEKKKIEQIDLNGVKTKAKIIDFTEVQSEEMHEPSQYFPVIQFTDNNGKIIVKTLLETKSRKKLNQFIEIIYYKKNTDYNIIQNNVYSKYLKSTILTTIGVLILLMQLNIIYETNL